MVEPSGPDLTRHLLPRRRRPARGAAAALLVAAAVAVSGCAAVPTYGPVRQGDTVETVEQEPLIRVLPRPPRNGMTPEQVVAGFLQSSASFDRDHAVARLYLTSAASAAWQPASRVVVYQSTVGDGLTRDDAGTLATGVTLQAPLAGVIGPEGDFSSAPPAARMVAQFGLRRVDGQWRISHAPQGLYLTRLDVERSFRAFDLYFLDPRLSVLVPDPVLVPVARQGLATSLVRSLLEGPTAWLAPAVRSAFPTGTRLVVDSVPIQNGVAQVDLTAAVLSADDHERQALSAQLVWTLRQLGDVTGVRITVQGSPLAVPGAGSMQGVSDWMSYGPDVLTDSATGYLVHDGAIEQLTANGTAPVPGVIGSGRYALSHPGVSIDGTVVAALSADGRTAYVQRSSNLSLLVPVLTGRSLLPPSFDVSGTLWLVDRRPGGARLWTVAPTGQVARVTAPALDHARLRAFRVSRDGTRAAAVVVDTRGRGVLVVGRVTHGPDGIAVTGVRRLGRSLVDVREVVWGDADHVTALARSRGAAPQPFAVGMNGQVDVAASALAGATVLAAAPGHPLLAASANGRVWSDTGLGWRALVTGSDPVYPG